MVGKSRIVGKKPTGKAGSGLGVKKLTTKVDDSLYEQAPEEAPVLPVLPEAEKAAPVAPTASRFAYDPEEEAKPVKKAVQRGKDGHLTLGGEGTDFFSNPMGDTSTRKNSGGYSPRYASTMWAAHDVPLRRFMRISHNTTMCCRASDGRRQQDSVVAQQRFANAKSISSDMFNEQSSGANDYEHQSRLSRFQGSAAISSADYFGDGSEPGRSNSASNMDASDLVNRLSYTARQDLQNLKSMATNASQKLSNMAQTFVRDLQGGY